MPEWIKVRKALPTDPDVLRLARHLDASIPETVGLLVIFWSWADEHLENGHAVGVTRLDVSSLMQRDGFAEGLENIGWLTFTDDGVDIPRFDRHMSQSAKNRALAAERKRRQRVPKVSRKKRDKSGTRREERRGTSPPRGSSPSEKKRRQRPGPKPGAAPPADPDDRVAALVGGRDRGTRFQKDRVKYDYRDDGTLWRWDAQAERWKLVS